MSRVSVAIIGAGLAGITAGRYLSEYADVTLYEKSRGVGGRIATRYAGDYEFDHGTQFFSIRHPAFHAMMQPLQEKGLIQPWHARFVEIEKDTITQRRTWDDKVKHWVGAPRMNQVIKALAEDLEIHCQQQVRVQASTRNGVSWDIISQHDKCLGSYDWVISTAPAAQSIDILPASFAHLEPLKSIQMLSCFAIMLGFEESLNLDWDAALVKKSDISWMAVNASKPARKPNTTMVIQARNSWADAHLEDGLDAVKSHLLGAAEEASGIALAHAPHQDIHRWRFANIPSQKGPAYWLDESQQLAACGDWCIKGRVESAFLSAYQLVQHLLESGQLAHSSAQ